MLDDHLTAEQKISKSRAQLMMDDVFFGAPAMHMIIREDLDGSLPYDTIATDGKEILYSRKYIDSLPVPEVGAEIAHEMGHVILKHHLRRGNRDPDTWNKACDQAVDHIISQCSHVRLNQKWIDNLNPHFKDKSAEEIYGYMQNQPGNQPGNQPNEKPDSQPKKSDGKMPKKGQKPQIGPDSHGLVFDSPVNLNDKTERQEAEEEVEIMAEEGAKLAGTLPGKLRELVRGKNEHQVNYREQLREFMEDNVIPKDYDWTVPDRTYIQMDLYIPGILEMPDKPKIVFVCDSSGSVGLAEKQVFANEISGVLEDFPCEITAIYCDTKVQNVQEITADEMPIKLEFKGGGGTNFAPAFQYIEDQGIEPKAILFFTDMMTSNFGKDPGVPVLWMNTNRMADSKSIPFGKMIKLDLKKPEQAKII